MLMFKKGRWQILTVKRLTQFLSLYAVSVGQKYLVIVMAKVKMNKGSYIFNQFPKDFLKPYGIATVKIDNDMLKRRLQPFTCEAIRRPGIGISQFAQTIEENGERLENLANLMNQLRIKEYIHVIDNYKKLTAGMHIKGDNIEKKQLKSKVQKLVRALKKKEKSMEIFMHLGASMYLIGLHCRVLRFCFTHTHWIKSKCKGKGTYTRRYKTWISKKQSEKESVNGYVEEIVNEIGNSAKKGVSMRFSQSDASESDTDEERRRKKRKTKETSDEESDSTGEDGESESECEVVSKKIGKIIESGDSDESSEEEKENIKVKSVAKKKHVVQKKKKVNKMQSDESESTEEEVKEKKVNDVLFL